MFVEPAAQVGLVDGVVELDEAWEDIADKGTGGDDFGPFGGRLEIYGLGGFVYRCFGPGG